VGGVGHWLFSTTGFVRTWISHKRSVCKGWQGKNIYKDRIKRIDEGYMKFNEKAPNKEEGIK
jgi:hypothetical protein